MKQTDIERFAFFYLCGEKDRELLQGTRKMSFHDFDRLTYLTEVIGLETYSMEIWNQYAGQFGKELKQVEISCFDGSAISWQEQAQIQDDWLKNFYNGIPDEQSIKYLAR